MEQTKPLSEILNESPAAAYLVAQAREMGKRITLHMPKSLLTPENEGKNFFCETIHGPVYFVCDQEGTLDFKVELEG